MRPDRLPQTLRTRDRYERLSRCSVDVAVGLGPEEPPEVTIPPPAKRSPSGTDETRERDQ